MHQTILKFRAAALLVAVAGIRYALVAEKDPDLIYSHTLHAQAGVECFTCHAAIKESESGLDDNLPKMAVCFTCHDDSPAGCTLCHLNPDSVSTYPRVTDYHQLFSHKTHIAAGSECTLCHTAIEEVELATAANLPGMESCLGCHKSDSGQGECALCHMKDVRHQQEDHY